MKYLINIYKLSALLFIYIFFSCQNSPMREKYKELKNSNIKFSNQLEVLYNGKDTMINDFWINALKIVIYKDSISCNECYIESLLQWNDLIDEYKNLNIRFYFILHPSSDKYEDIKLLLRTIEFNYPIIIDYNGYFRKMNPQISDDPNLHTFLLNRNNKVILIGNPLYSDNINMLLKKELFK